MTADVSRLSPPPDRATPRPPRWPQPLAALPVDALAALRGVLTDIDDTLTRDGAIEASALAALHALAEAGWPVVAITGRPAGWSMPFVRAWPLAAIVAENGGVLLTRDDAAAHGVRLRFTVDDAERARRFARLQAAAAAVLAEVDGATLARDSAGRLTDIAVDHSEFAQLTPAQVDAVLQRMRGHGLTATVSSIHINGWLGEHDKRSGAAWALRAVLGLNFDPAQWLYVGDSANDQGLFGAVALSVGVANIAPLLPNLHTPPAFIARGERGDGFAEVAARLLARPGQVSAR